MTRSTRAIRAAFALTVATWSHACTAYRVPRADHPLEQGQRLRVSAQVPFPMGPPSPEDPWTPCMVTSVTGDVQRVAGDTILLVRAVDVVPAAQRDGSPGRCAPHSAVNVVRTSTTEVTVQQGDPLRTALTLGTIVAVVVGLAALAASQIEYKTTSGGCSTCF